MEISNFIAEIGKAINHAIYFQYTTVNELVWFTILVLAYFLFRLMIRRHRLRLARMKIPFSIGGWGTRGKSGTERKKAALFHGLGYNVLSKTTGCEAMVIHSRPGIEPIELPIYRPGDKSGIWEQEKVLGWAAKFNTHVFLWECMAVSSDYAGLMQHEWMNDDYSTLSNAFVDHENIQGPAGIDIPRSLSSFIPSNAVLFTAEENMLPIIKARAKRLGTTVIDLPWFKSDLIADDVMKLFPYKVHTRNLGMVMNLAHHLGIDRDLALKEIADNIVPDLGAFNHFETEFQNRSIEFWNGMSANDRTSSLSNWNNAGFNESFTDQKVFVVTVINNRHDRVARSFEFAEIVVDSTPAHLHVLIGTNLEGMQGYIRESVKRFAERNARIGDAISKLSPQDAVLKIKENINRILNWLRIDSLSDSYLSRKLHTMFLDQQDPDKIDAFMNSLLKSGAMDRSEIESVLRANFEGDYEFEEIASQLEHDLFEYKSIRQFLMDAEKLSKNYLHNPSSKQLLEIEQIYFAILHKIMLNRLDIIWNPFATGDQIINSIIRKSPPGFRIKIMGLQNIKGTGLDFAYRWVSLNKIQKTVKDLSSDELETRKSAVIWLAAHDDYGILDAPLALKELKQALIDSKNQLPEIRSVIEDAIVKIERILDQKKESLKSKGLGKFKRIWARFFEQLLDAGDSRRRLKICNQVFEDLFENRISHAKAAKILHDMSKRQEGGWLLKK